MGRKLNIDNGTKFGRLAVLKEVEGRVFPSGQKRRQFKCQCECGNRVVIGLPDLRSEHTKSCGCLRVDLLTKHGLARHFQYNRCFDAINRCHNPDSADFHRYGSRGIEVFDEWRKDISKFIRYVENLEGANDPALTMDRIDNDGNYVPGNLRFATKSVQARNQSIQGNTPFLGVHKDGSRYRSRISINGKSINLGTFETPEEAESAYKRAKVRALASDE